MEPTRDPHASDTPKDPTGTPEEPASPSEEPAGTPPPPAPEPTPTPQTSLPESGAAGATEAPDKPDDAKRFLALFIDGIIAGVAYGIVSVIVGAIVPGLWTSIWAGVLAGGLVAGAYILVRDGLDLDFMKQRSLGKKIIGLKPVRLDGQPMDIETSVKRNWPLAFGYLSAIPTIGWLLGLASLGLVIYEIYKVLTDEQGRRWGDELAGTRVVTAS